MHELKSQLEQQQPEHLQVANNFSRECLERFNPEEVNEILSKIREIFKKEREEQIENLEKKLEYLKMTNQNLI
jgi:hypothetical protein